MTATLPEIAIGLSRNSSLCLSDRLDNYLRLSHKVIKAPAGNGIAACVYKERSFDEIAGRHSARCAVFDRTRARIRLGLVAQNSDERGRVHYHRGNPRSSYSRSA